MIYRVALFCSAMLITLGLAAQDSARKQNTKNCLPTVGNSGLFVPPQPYLQRNTPAGMFWYGTDELWTLLDSQGVWKKSVSKDCLAFCTKLTYWASGFNPRTEIEPELTVTARRLDIETKVIVGDHAHAVFTDGPMPAGMMTAIDLPTSGCWKITAKYREHELSFIRSVQ